MRMNQIDPDLAKSPPQFARLAQEGADPGGCACSADAGDVVQRQRNEAAQLCLSGPIARIACEGDIVSASPQIGSQIQHMPLNATGSEIRADLKNAHDTTVSRVRGAGQWPDYRTRRICGTCRRAATTLVPG
jgi:hypothetical protein